MNTKLFLAVSSMLAATLALPFGGQTKASEVGASPSQLVLKVQGIQSMEGHILVGLYNTEAGFESEREIMGQTVDVSGETTEIVFDDLPAGNYALKVFHDEDADGELDTNVLGIPSEPFGFSNNASDPFSAPEWDETQFPVTERRVTHSIDLG